MTNSKNVTSINKEGGIFVTIKTDIIILFIKLSYLFIYNNKHFYYLIL